MTDFIAQLEEQLVTAHREGRRRRVPWRGGAVVVAAAVSVAAVVAVVLALATPQDRQAARTKPPTTTATAPGPHDATVAVLNGTTVTGLARAAADRLVSTGFREGVITNDATSQQRPRTEIYYEPGYREQARTAAISIGIGRDRVLPMTANARVLGDRADIVVFVGADKAR